MQIATGLTVVGAMLCLAACRRGPDSTHAADRATSGDGRQWFEDATQRAGLQFVHQTGPTGRYLMPEQLGGGAALFDYDGDGRLDVYLVQNAGPDSGVVNQLFHQEADGRFSDATAGSGLDVAGHGMGVAVGDANNDGRPDVLVTEYGRVRFFLNEGGGRFRDISSEAGLDNPRWASAAAFFDYDRDGWLDLVIGNYLDYDPSVKCRDARGAPEYCAPHGFSGLAARLFRNQTGRDGNRSVRFEDVSVSSGLARVPGPALGVWCADFDGDRWPDIFLADDARPNRLFMNQRNGTFVEEAVARGLAYNAMGQAVGNMGVAAGDVDGDGRFDLFVTHLAEELHALWVQRARGVFVDRIGPSGLARQGWRGTGFGAVLVDFDNNGALDLAFVNGRVRRGATDGPVADGTPPFWAPYAQRPQIFTNDGQGNFREVSSMQPAFSGRASVGRGLACGDLDNDGGVDLLVTSVGGPVRLFRNVAPARGHWLSVRAVDPARGGRDAHGAEVIVHVGNRSHWRLIQPSFSYLVSNDPRAHFGLGTAPSVDSIEVIWPDGVTETFPGGAADRQVIVSRGRGRVAHAEPD